MKRTVVSDEMSVLVVDYTYHFELCSHNNFKESRVKSLPGFWIAKHAETTFAIDDIGTMQNNGFVGSRSENASFEMFKIICKSDIIIGLLEPYTKECKVTMRDFLKKIICMVTRLVDIEPIARFL